MKNVELIKETEFDFSPNYGYGEEFTGYRLNMPVVEAFKLLGLKDWYDFYPAMLTLGAKEPFAIIASEDDANDIRRIEAITEESEQDQWHNVIQVLINLCYQDFPFEVDGKWGLKCSTGRVVVPPMFEECKGADNLAMIDTFAAVKLNGRWWLTPRDNSGRLMTDIGYDSILRSNSYAWVKNTGKVGLLSSINAEVIIPCEHDWMVNDGAFGLWCIGKGDKVGVFDMEFNPVNYDASNDKFYPAIYDAIDATTGKICFNGKWGWLLKDGSVTEIPPKRYDTPLHPGELPFDSEVAFIGTTIEEKGVNQIDGVKHLAMKKSRQNSTNVQLPKLKDVDVMVDIDSVVAEKFSLLEYQSQNISIDMAGKGLLTIQLTPVNDEKWNVTVSWIDDNQKDMAFDSMFPLINACHRIIYSKGGIYHVEFKLEIHECDIDLPMKFISALLSYRKRKNSFLHKYDNQEF